MFLEPVYLNETMLMNYASYLFSGVTLETETTTSTAKTKKTHGEIKGGIDVGMNVFENIAKGVGNLNINGENKVLEEFHNTMVKRITLGSLHMKLIENIDIQEISYSSLQSKPSAEKYVKIQAILKPIEFYTILEILKLISSQSENFLNSTGQIFFKPEQGQNQDAQLVAEKVQTAINTTQALSGLIKELEEDYLKSNLLEMIMTDEEGNNIGVLDIDVTEKIPSEMKAQLTDGEFIIYGKIVRYINKDSELNLVQRSLLPAITDNLNKVVNVMDLFQWESSEFLQSWHNTVNLAGYMLNEVITLKMKGPVIRVKAMSVCM